MLGPLTPMVDWDLISPYDIIPESLIMITRIEEIVIN